MIYYIEIYLELTMLVDRGEELGVLWREWLWAYN